MVRCVRSYLVLIAPVIVLILIVVAVAILWGASLDDMPVLLRHRLREAPVVPWE